MSIGRFTDKARPPTAEEMREAPAGALPLWDDLVGAKNLIRICRGLTL